MLDPVEEELLDALGGLEAQWRRFDAPIAAALEPGMSSEQIDELAEPYGLRIPMEIKALWGWHNGAQRSPDGHRWRFGPSGFEFHSAEDCLERFASERRIHHVSPEPEDLPDLFWHASWLPFMTWEAVRLYVDYEREDPWGASPVRLVTREWENFQVDRAVSVAQVIRTWTWVLENDLLRLVRAESGDAWWEETTSEAVPRFIRLSGLA